MNPEIEIYGVIGDDKNGVTTKSIAQQLREIGDDVDEIDVRINSDGGSVSQGVAIAGLLKNHPANIHTIIEGGSFSIASYIACVGDRRTIHADAVFHTHGPQSKTNGNLEDHEDSIKELKIATRSMSKRFAELTGQDVEEIVDGFARDLFFDAEEAVEAGYMTDIADEARVVAQVNTNQVNNIPSRFAAALVGNGLGKTKKGKTMAVATAKQLRKKFPKASKEFLFDQVEAEASIETATASYVTMLEKRNTSLERTVAELKEGSEAEDDDDDDLADASDDSESDVVAELRAQIQALQDELDAMLDDDDELEAEDDDEMVAEEDEEAEAEYDEDEEATANARAKAQRARDRRKKNARAKALKRSGRKDRARGHNNRHSNNGRHRTGARTVDKSRSNSRRQTVKEEYEKRVKDRMTSENVDKKTAVAQVFREDPDLRERLVDEANS